MDKRAYVIVLLCGFAVAQSTVAFASSFVASCGNTGIMGSSPNFCIYASGWQPNPANLQLYMSGKPTNWTSPIYLTDIGGGQIYGPSSCSLGSTCYQYNVNTGDISHVILNNLGKLAPSPTYCQQILQTQSTCQNVTSGYIYLKINDSANIGVAAEYYNVTIWNVTYVTGGACSVCYPAGTYKYMIRTYNQYNLTTTTTTIPWSVSVSPSSENVSVGTSVTLTVTANRTVTAPYSMIIYNDATGAVIVRCTSGFTCSGSVSQSFPVGITYDAGIQYCITNNSTTSCSMPAEKFIEVTWKGSTTTTTTTSTTILGSGLSVTLAANRTSLETGR